MFLLIFRSVQKCSYLVISFINEKDYIVSLMSHFVSDISLLIMCAEKWRTKQLVLCKIKIAANTVVFSASVQLARYLQNRKCSACSRTSEGMNVFK